MQTHFHLGFVKSKQVKARMWGEKRQKTVKTIGYITNQQHVPKAAQKFKQQILCIWHHCKPKSSVYPAFQHH